MASPRSKLAFRSRDRKVVKQLEKAIQHIKSMDTRRTDAAAKIGADPVLFAATGLTAVIDGLNALTLRCIDALDLRVSDGALIS